MLTEDPISSGLILVVIYAALLWAMRRVMAALLLRQMEAVSKAAPGRNTPAGDTARRTKSKLGFERLDAQPLSPEVLRMRNAAVAPARRLFRLATALDMGAGLAYIEAAGDADKANVGYVAAAVLVIALLRYLMYRRQYFGRRGWLLGHMTGPMVLAEVVATPRWQPVWRGLLLAVAVLGIRYAEKPAVGLALGAIAACQTIAMIWLSRRVRRDAGLSLLLLRVFGNDKAVRLTFGGLLDRWQHVGPYVTVLDASLLRQRTAFMTWGNYLLRVVVMWFAALVGWEQPLYTVAVVLACLGVDATLMYRRISSQRVDSHEGLLKLLAAAGRQPRGSDLRFRTLEVSCFENTWRDAVAEFARRSRVVLMDLRGYTPGRTGCNFEVDFLFDRVPLARMAFLVQPQDLSSVEQLLCERWQEQDEASPNLGLAQPTAKVYVTGSSPEDDMQRLLDELIGIAAMQPPASDDAANLASAGDALQPA
jgi:hypothetical protein